MDIIQVRLVLSNDGLGMTAVNVILATEQRGRHVKHGQYSVGRKSHGAELAPSGKMLPLVYS